MFVLLSDQAPSGLFTLPALSPAEVFSSEAILFDVARPLVFPLATEVLAFAREWVISALGSARSGYQTAVSEAPPARPARGTKVKRPTVAALAQQQEVIMQSLADVSSQCEYRCRGHAHAPATCTEGPNCSVAGLRPRRCPGSPYGEDSRGPSPGDGPVGFDAEGSRLQETKTPAKTKPVKTLAEDLEGSDADLAEEDEPVMQAEGGGQIALAISKLASIAETLAVMPWL